MLGSLPVCPLPGPWLPLLLLALSLLQAEVKKGKAEASGKSDEVVAFGTLQDLGWKETTISHPLLTYQRPSVLHAFS